MYISFVNTASIKFEPLDFDLPQFTPLIESEWISVTINVHLIRFGLRANVPDIRI